MEVAQAFARAQSQIQKLRDTLQLGPKHPVVRRSERNRLGESAAGLDKHELGAECGLCRSVLSGRLRCRGLQRRRRHFPERDVGGELRKVARIIRAQFAFLDGKRSGDCLDFAKGDGAGGAQQLVDAPRELQGPAAVENPAFDCDFERGLGFGGGRLGAKLLVPVRAELGAPQTGRSAAAVARPHREIGEFPDTQAGGALVEGEFHAGRPHERHESLEKKAPPAFFRKRAASI